MKQQTANSKQQIAIASFIINLFLFPTMVYTQTDLEITWDDIVSMSDSISTDGADTIYYLDENTETINRSSGFGLTGNISINLSGNVYTINQGMFGVNVTGMFDNDAMPNDGSADDQWDWMSQMRLKTLRMPAGANSEFMHPYTGTKGWGYNITEIVNYFDAVDGSMNFPDIDSIVNYSITTNDTIFNWWTGSAEYSSRFNEFRLAYKEQIALPTGKKYLNDFIELVKKNENENGYTVDVIVCLNILTDKASDCLNMINYMRSAALNGIYSVNVVGVEMGNECASKFYKNVMKFDNGFDDYWYYINGWEVMNQSSWETTLGTSLFMPESDHNFLPVFKTTSGFSCKVGLPGDNLADSTKVYGLSPITSGTRSASDWNIPLHNKDTAKYSAALGGKYKYDAVILHTYYNAISGNRHWWDVCATENLEDSYPGPGWSFMIADSRLENAYNDVLDSFKLFITKYNKESFDAFNDIFHFETTSAKKKDLWVTEQNLKPEAEFSSLPNVYINGFTHCYVFQEWWMRNLKLNYTNTYRTNFFTYSTIQSYGSGSGIHLLTPAEKFNTDSSNVNELAFAEVDRNYSPYNLPKDNPASRNYYLRRSTYWNMFLLKEISENHLVYMKLNSGIPLGNQNIVPTAFASLSALTVTLYFYYSNRKDEEQTYHLIKGSIGDLFPGKEVAFDSATLYYINASESYSNSGKSYLYDINNYYDAEHAYPYEIDTITEAINNPACEDVSDNSCITVPAYSVGYFTVQIKTSPLKESASQNNILTIYPNPATDYLNISLKKNEIVSVKIINDFGQTIIDESFFNNNKLDITNLSYGHYIIEVLTSGGEKIFSQFIKQ